MSYQTEDTSSSNTENFLDECQLVRRAHDGDQQAFELLYERYNTRICRYLSRMVGNDGVGCELTQETFLKAWESLPSLREPARFAGWLYRIATNCAYNYQQRAKHLHLVPWDAYRERDEELSVAGPEEQVEETELLQQALARVSPTYRPCLILYVIEELPQRKIADLLKIKETSVGKYVSRGKEELRQIYHRLVMEQGAAMQRGK
ncbi:MAG TPA: RNA polymerase sigma factor [Ktedonobacteraceae bacterium]|nr:RNA polymerase sigma factor [Ktedonobacteraceae bacterium]